MQLLSHLADPAGGHAAAGSGDGGLVVAGAVLVLGGLIAYWLLRHRLRA